MKVKLIELENRLAEFHRGDDRGAGMVEYGLLVAFIALIALVGVKAFGIKLNGLFTGFNF